MPEPNKTLTLKGRTISPGMGEGNIFVHLILSEPLDVPEYIVKRDVDDEISRLDDAIVKISDDLVALASRVEKEIDTSLSKVFDVHKLILEDSSLKKELRKEIVGNLMCASSAVKTVFQRWEDRFLLMESQIAKDKGDDMRDLSNRLCSALAGISLHPLEEIPLGSVLVSKRLLPSDTVFLSSHSIAAVLLEFGSNGSHAALFAREMGLPCIAGLVDLVSTVPDGAPALVDADEGTITLRPDETQRAAFQDRVAERKQDFCRARDQAMKSALTKDKVTITVLANVGCRDDTQLAIANGAEGVGLYRIEQVYLGRVEPPSEDELYEEMFKTLEPAKGKPVGVRLLDAGADKPLPFLKSLDESNPALGRRGIRLLLEYPDFLDTQLRTILKLAAEFDISILVPMITLPDEMAAVRVRLTELGSEMGISSVPRLGAMIETPAAALSAIELAPFSDFLSFGSNDLTQYAFAADRENTAVERYFNDSSEVIFRFFKITRDDVPEMPLSVCGELAGRSSHIPKLLKCGIRTLSVAPPLIPSVKETIRDSYTSE